MIYLQFLEPDLVDSAVFCHMTQYNTVWVLNDSLENTDKEPTQTFVNYIMQQTELKS